MSSALRAHTQQGINHVLEHQGLSFSSRDVFALLQVSIQKKDLASGRRLQALLQTHHLDSDAYWGDHLVRLFAACNKLSEADRAFHAVKKPSVYTWSAIISAHVKHTQDERAIQLFFKMLQEGTHPDKITFLYCLKACKNLGCAWRLMAMHDRIIIHGLQSENVIANALVDAYAKCGTLAEGHNVFNSMPHQDVISWCALITGYTAHGKGLNALQLYETMLLAHVQPDRVIFISVLKACGSINAAREAMIIHEQVVRNSLESDLFIGSSLVDIYAKCACLQEAQRVFDKLQHRNAVSWAALIVGYALHGDAHQAIEVLERMQKNCNDIDRVAFLSILKACGSVVALQHGRLVHKQMIEKGCLPDKVLANTLVDMYCRCGSVEDASCVFAKLPTRDIVSWGAMIAGYCGFGLGLDALCLFDQMQQTGGEANVAIYLPLLSACSSLETLEHGMLLHDQLIKQSYDSDAAIANKLVDMYAKHGRVKEAENVFHAMPHRDVVSWGTMILGCAEHGYGPAALEFFGKMWQECTYADKVIFLCVLKACTRTGAIKLGMLIHYQIMSVGLDHDTDVGNTLVDMYAKTSFVDEARRAFDQLHTRDGVSWAAIISGYALCGNFQIAGECLKDMQRQGLQLREEIVTSILLACTHAGDVNEGYNFFELMIREYGIVPDIEHYSCIIDLLGRVGHLKEAISLLITMPISADTIVWTSLLTSCKTYHNVDLGRKCFYEVSKRDPDDASAYILMSKIYADAEMWEEVEKLRAMRKWACAQKKRGVTWLEVNNKVHEFIVGEKYPDLGYIISCKYERLRKLIKTSAYMPQLDLVVDPMFIE